ncbi:MAG: hypothetical protein JRD89_04105 [Deltaproteobacteria bacterium]|nr:hypothetical protein [Deltaproteobacteria bacterium]
MTWSYDSTLPTDKDKVRFHIGDTDQSDQLLQDEEISYLLGETTNVLLAASRAAKAIAARFSRQADKAVGDLRISLSQKAQAYMSLAADLEKRALTSSACPTWQKPEEDARFELGMMENDSVLADEDDD